MGCDIHLTVEIKDPVTGEWGHTAPAIFNNGWTGHEEISDTPFDQRHYGMFAFFADVRNYSAIPHNFGKVPRGIPHDSPYFRKSEPKPGAFGIGYGAWDENDYVYGGDYHSHSYLGNYILDIPRRLRSLALALGVLLILCGAASGKSLVGKVGIAPASLVDNFSSCRLKNIFVANTSIKHEILLPVFNQLPLIVLVKDAIRVKLGFNPEAVFIYDKGVTRHSKRAGVYRWDREVIGVRNKQMRRTPTYNLGWSSALIKAGEKAETIIAAGCFMGYRHPSSFGVDDVLSGQSGSFGVVTSSSGKLLQTGSMLLHNVRLLTNLSECEVENNGLADQRHQLQSTDQNQIPCELGEFLVGLVGEFLVGLVGEFLVGLVCMCVMFWGGVLIIDDDNSVRKRACGVLLVLISFAVLVSTLAAAAFGNPSVVFGLANA